MPKGKTRQETMTREEMLSHVMYDSITGAFIRVRDSGFGVGRVRVGDRVGTINADGYAVAQIAGVEFRLHRVAWMIVTGEWPRPDQDVDHVNGKRDDNRFENLRVCERSQNLANGRSKGSSSKYRGVSYDRTRRIWMAQCGRKGVGRKTIYCKSELEAARAYDAMAVGYFGDFARLNFKDGALS